MNLQNKKTSEHRNMIGQLSIEIDGNAQNFTLYADRLENKLQTRPIQKLAGDDIKFWAYDLDGVMIERYWDKMVGDEVMIRGVGEVDEGWLKGVAGKIVDKSDR